MSVWPHGDAREKGRVITVRRERLSSSPGLTSAGFPLLQAFHPADPWRPQIPCLCWPSQAAADSVCPS